MADEHGEERSRLQGTIVDSLTNQTTVTLFSKDRFEFSKILQQQKKEMNTQEKAFSYVERVRTYQGVASICLGLPMNGYMLYAWRYSEITTGDVVFAFTISWNIVMMIWYVSSSFPQLLKEIGHCRQALSLIRAPHEVRDIVNAKPLVIEKGNIVFENVSFHYDSNHALFHEKTVTLRAGEKTGLVGFSGGGKTSFIHLILRFFDPEKGRILIDGQDISKVTQESLRANIATIPQETSLFHRSLMDNIRYGNPKASFEEVVEAAKKAHAHEFIEKLPLGYETLIGERGLKLSGGQRQRIALARAILKNAPILILDEATSALDSMTEKYIQDSLETLMQGRTTIAIAHRLSTLNHMDRILVFHNGKITEDGTHKELLALNGAYAQMWKMQVDGMVGKDGS
ncbi:MAG TPA: ABC transporter ATP-binding protein [Chlamydiales bacterium]|nr:ABC transporter ATP-binding protein [Chlamydiales bacterium]